jgi:hypothetical protein
MSARPRIGHVVVVAVLIAAVLAPRSAAAYLNLSVDLRGQTVRLRWASTPIRWFASNRGGPGVSAADFQAAAARAFATWQAVPTASLSFQFVGFTSASPLDDDSIPTLGFENRPDLERVLGATGFVLDTVTGEIVESDIFFNSAFAWSVSASGTPSAFDVQSVATHEIGHFLGLGHSALGETEPRPDGGRRVLASGAVMFPISFGRGNTADRELQPDDIAGISDLYPSSTFRAQTGVIRGRVQRGGRAVFGAHVIAFNPSTGQSIAGFALGDDGSFQIAGLSPGPYVIRVEPLDDADVESFFDESVDTNFSVTFYDHLLVAPKGGAGDRVDVTVRPK